MEGVYFPPRLPGRAQGKSHTVLRDRGGQLITLCQNFPILAPECVDADAGESMVQCQRCIGLLLKQKAEHRPRPNVPEAKAVAALPVVMTPGSLRVDPRQKHLSHDQVVNAGVLRLLNTEARGLLPPGCFFTSEADRSRGGQALLRIVDAFDDAELLTHAIKLIEQTRR